MNDGTSSFSLSVRLFGSGSSGVRHREVNFYAVVATLYVFFLLTSE